MANSLVMRERQKEDKRQEYRRSQDEKEKEYVKRMYYERDMQFQNSWNRQERFKKQHEYNDELGLLVHEKVAREALDRKVTENVMGKHNPITNPIQFHIDNPYFLKRMQERKHPV